MTAVNTKRSWIDEMDDPQDDCKASKLSKRGGSRESSNSRKRSKPNNKYDANKKAWPPKKPMELETDPSVLQRRQKQIDYGKNTVGYSNYIAQVPIDKRTKDQPKTPDKFSKYSRRSWDRLIKIWRKKLHNFDADHESGDDIEVTVEDFEDYEDYDESDNDDASDK